MTQPYPNCPNCGPDWDGEEGQLGCCSEWVGECYDCDARWYMRTGKPWSGDSSDSTHQCGITVNG